MARHRSDRRRLGRVPVLHGMACFQGVVMSASRFPRTMNEAFPRTAQYGCAIEVHLCFSTRVGLWLCNLWSLK